MLLPWYFIRSLPPNHPLFSCKGLFSTKSKKKILEIRWISNIGRYFCYFFCSFSYIIIIVILRFLQGHTDGSKTAVCLSSLCVCARARLYVRTGRPTRWFLQEHLLVLTVRRFFCGKCDVFSFFFIATTSIKKYFRLCKSHYFLFFS
jgi:hypothetical protein